ncbi:MAG TPA: FkbM family methyltransferase [Candidatus Binatia bacterium]|jgi:FkbM family methyltransferase|nr:FkbM family methyltransferase [Candidatus Binatia bacterium]
MTQAIVYPPRWIRTLQRYRQLVTVFKGWPKFLATKWGWKKDNLELETRSGLKLIVPDQARFEFKDVFLHRAYGFRPLLQQLPPEPVVLDVGANVGFFSLFAFQCRPGSFCLAFEPLPANFRVLKHHQELNPTRRWQVFQQAVMARDGEVEICSQKNNQVDASARITTAGLPAAPGGRQPQKVLARSLPSIFAAHRLSRCHWLKLDCEGSEYEILYQCPADTLRQIEAISLEIHHRDEQSGNQRALCAYLEGHGFRLFAADDAVVHALR